MIAASVSISDRKKIPVIKIKLRITPPLARFVIIHSPEFLFSIKHKRTSEITFTNSRFSFYRVKLKVVFGVNPPSFFVSGKNYL
jgi:hypothetical protein